MEREEGRSFDDLFRFRYYYCSISMPREREYRLKPVESFRVENEKIVRFSCALFYPKGEARGRERVEGEGIDYD